MLNKANHQILIDQVINFLFVLFVKIKRKSKKQQTNQSIKELKNKESIYINCILIKQKRERQAIINTNSRFLFFKESIKQIGQLWLITRHLSIQASQQANKLSLISKSQSVLENRQARVKANILISQSVQQLIYI
ncbi:hypothetical protein TTHERM_001026261 (macronuclear) [Tetrahymena thermophila SB210]|uniref:Uncharacterized protein n=1 Tax=Tetrahymena thermophila (strain SB210) TaxID=312017 RepID=W7XLC3_TETTS|nr:hypothetical protein TTHERM_001026261 [Tetrahymena thermophila SB210]EWS76039.1 hypothetical protein TTHERM_001026261 [Tetrahymena thermophila SB210]|eukprot:XP_012651423.1 hypothetical protein TTHERM_001026261 [Tetrahymena thermophila SB210]